MFPSGAGGPAASLSIGSIPAAPAMGEMFLPQEGWESESQIPTGHLPQEPPGSYCTLNHSD